MMRRDRTTVLCAYAVLVSVVSVSPVLSEEQAASQTPAASDGRIASLLMDIELALMSGKAVSLDLSDKLIEARTLLPTASADGRRMLKDFPNRLEQDQARLPKDEDETKVINLRVFGSVAAQYIDNTTLMDDRPVVSPEPQIIKPPPEPVKPTEQVAIVVPIAPPPQTAPPQRATPPPPPAPVVTPPVPSPPVPSPRSPAVIALVERGDTMMDLGDITAARLLYQRAAESGSGSAAMKLANTYDPGFISSHHVIGMKADRATAAIWYRKAVALGESKAEERLASIVESMTH